SLGCIEGAEKIKEAYEDGVDSIIVPSRGACPIVRGVIKAIEEYAAHKGGDYETIYNALQIPPFMKNGYKGGEEKDKKYESKDKNLRKIAVIPYPLTADVSLSEDLLREYGTNLDYVTDSIRNYGAEVIASFTQHPEERANNNKFNFLTFVFEDVEGRKEEADFYRNIEQINYFLVFDTVVSGRSLSTIVKNLENLKVKYRAIGVVDVNGAKLKLEYRKILNSSGKVELIEVDRILSEDRGASLLGVVGCIYPNLALEAKEDLDIRPCGAVTWHHIPYNSRNKISQEMKESFNLHNQVFKDYIGAIYDGIELLVREKPEKDTESRMKEKIERVARSIEEHRLLNHGREFLDPYAFVKDNIKVEDIYESSSHVIHILFPPDEIKKLLKVYREKYRKINKK
ncbi:MAG: hypothetical protein QXZ20_02440, partial [Candidatus Aenigmatarchaeota archaeon]